MGKKYYSNYDGDDRQKWVRIAIAQKDKEAITALLNSEEGRWFIARLMKNEGLMSTAFTGNSGTFYNEGRRSVAVDIYQNIKSLLGVEGIKLFHSAQEELLEFEERALEQAKGEDNG
jgi:hypothetical protein